MKRLFAAMLLAALSGTAAAAYPLKPISLPAEVREDPEFLQKATSVFAPLRYLSPIKQLWKELPWGDK